MALHFATQNGHRDVLRLLLGKGANIETKEEVSAVRAMHVGYGGGN
jgi:ankyrin repeat protein